MNQNLNIDFSNLNGNREGAVAAIVLIGATAIGALCMYGIDAINGVNGSNLQ